MMIPGYSGIEASKTNRPFRAPVKTALAMLALFGKNRAVARNGNRCYGAYLFANSASVTIIAYAVPFIEYFNAQ